MSLQIWLPLNGNLDNQGLSGVKPTISSPIYNNGKIGQCLLLDKQIDTTLPFANWDYVTNSCSFCCWVKVSLADLQTIANGKTFDSTNSTMGGTLLGKDSYGGVALRWKTNNLSSSKTITQVTLYGHIRNTNSNSQVTNSYVLPFDTWTHVALVINRSTQTMGMYINGKLFNEKGIGGVTGTFPTGNFLICQSSWDGGNGVSSPGKFSLNDVRVYDHALSAKEVKELAKGLVLHYRLAGPGVPNQARNTSRTYTNPYSSFNGGINTCINLSRVDTSGLKVGDIIHVHLEYKYNNIVPSSGQTASCWIQGAGNVTDWNSGIFTGSPHITLSGSGVYIFNYNITITADHLKNEYWPTNIRHDYIQTGSVQWKDFKVEKCSIATPWCPHPADALYTAMGYNNNIEYDCSGYRRNGIKSGTITWDIDSLRYTTSYKFGSNTSKIKLPAFNMSGFANSYTFSWWQYNIGSDNMPWGFSDGNRLNPYHTGNLCWNTGDGGSNPFVPNIISSTLYNTWHHIVITGNGTDTKLYIDGEYKGKATTYKSLTGTQIYLSGWDTGTSYTMTGSREADFRIYATALSAEDIAELYHSAVIIDNTGKNYAYEYFEA